MMQQLKITLLSCLSFLLMMSCKDDSDIELVTSDTVVGSWSLVRIEGGFSPTVNTFNKGEVTLDFSDSQVTINNQSDEMDLGFSEGEYAYTLTLEEDNQSLLIGDGMLNGVLELHTTQFTIDQRHFDGPLYTFERN